jgi:hypothetical protein
LKDWTPWQRSKRSTLYFLKFIQDVRDCCKQAYERLSTALGEVRNLPSKPSPKQVDDASATINAAPNSKWFKDVSGICDRLAALATDFDADLSQQIQYTSPTGENWQESLKAPNQPRFAAHYRIAPLLSLLHKQERDLKEDIRNTVACATSSPPQETNSTNAAVLIVAVQGQ